MSKRNEYALLALASLFVGLGLAVMLVWPSTTAPMLGVILGAAFAAGLILAPRTALFAFVAFPPGLLILATSSTGGVLWVQYFVIVLGLAVALLNRRSIGDKRFFAGFALLTSIMLLSQLIAPISGAREATVTIVNFVYYLAVYLLVLNVAPGRVSERATYVSHLQVGVLLSVLITGGIAISQVGWGFITHLSISAFPENAGFLYTRTHFGYLMAVGAVIALPPMVLRTGRRYLWVLATSASLLFVLVSVTRGAWITVALFMVLLALITRSWKLLLVLPALGLLYGIPGVQARLTSDFGGGLPMAVRTGSAGSHRVLLWSVLWSIAIRSPILGHGVGFVSSLSPDLIFGEGQFVAAGNPLVYAHNDYLFLFLERGIIAVGLYVYAVVSWWGGLIQRVRTAIHEMDSSRLALLLACVGVGLTTMMAQLVDNGFFINSLYERFVVLAACAALLASGREEEAGENA